MIKLNIKRRMEKQENTAVVTGSSTGIGLETSLLLARSGFYTYATMRDTNKRQIIEKIANKENLPLEVLCLKIDILVNNAGYGLFGALEDISIGAIKKQFETNLFGAVRTIKEILPIMRKQRNGIIINVSSISGIVGFPAQSVYVSTKFALEGLSEAISYELEQYGIKVILIEPGVINTNFAPNIKLPNPINNKLQQTMLKEQKPAIDYSNYDTKKG